MKKGMVWIILAALFLSACAGQAVTKTGGIEISAPWARAAAAMPGMGGANGAAYMVIRNHSAQPDRLLKAESSVAGAVELHKSEMKDGVMSMAPVPAIDVPANGQVELKSGGLHIMLIGLKQDLKPGDQITLTLTFEKAGKIEVKADVKAQ